MPRALRSIAAQYYGPDLTVQSLEATTWEMVGQNSPEESLDSSESPKATDWNATFAGIQALPVNMRVLT